jgi:hypothetical protein
MNPVNPPRPYSNLLGSALSGARTPGSYAPTAKEVYSLAKVQLTDGTVLNMTVSFGPGMMASVLVGSKEGGYIHLFNDTESLAIRADRVVAIHLTKMTTE